MLQTNDARIVGVRSAEQSVGNEKIYWYSFGAATAGSSPDFKISR